MYRYICNYSGYKLILWLLTESIDDRQEALNRYGTLETLNSDKGSQFTSLAFAAVLKEHGIRISLDRSTGRHVRVDTSREALS